MAKKRTSKVVNRIIKGGANKELLQTELIEARARLSQLQRENDLLKQRVKSLSATTAKQRQIIKSKAGQVKSAQQTVQELQTALKKIKKATRQITKTIKSPKILFGKKPTLTKEQVFEIYRQIDYTRFWMRIESVIDFDSVEDREKLAEMKLHMAEMSSDNIRNLIRITELRSTWYDSDAQWNANELVKYDVDNLYNIIMSY